MEWNSFANHLRHLSEKDQQKVRVAFDLGKERHGDQKRKSGEPYFTHPIAVATMLADMGADTDTIIAALLHDSIEDTNLTLEEVDTKFNGSAAKLIDGLTKLTPEDVADAPSLDDQIETLRKMFTLMEEDVRVMVIKLVDRLHNMQTIEALTPERQISMAQETLDVYVKIAERLSMQDLRDDLEDLCYKILEPEQYEELKILQAENAVEGEKIVKDIQKQLAKIAPKSLSFSTTFERKLWDRLKKQHELQGSTATGEATHTIAIVVDNVMECYQILGMLHQLWQRETLSFSDFISSPRINGYQSIHTTLLMKDGLRIRCKIRTKEMHTYAKKGIITKCFDNEAEGLLSYLPWTENISSLVNDTKKQSEEFWQSLKSDILQETIVVHGPADEATTIPKGSTALDAAFYILKKKALRIKCIRVNGKEVPYATPLEHAVSLDFECSSARTAERDWLEFVQTGFAVALIREALRQHPESLKVKTGKQLLQEELDRRHGGFVEEYDPKSLERSVQKAGFSSLNEAYHALAEGHLSLSDLHKALFSKRSSSKSLRTADINFLLSAENVHAIAKIVNLYKSHKKNYKHLRFSYNPSREKLQVFVNISLPAEQFDAFMAELSAIGADNVSITNTLANKCARWSLVLLSILWALDCLLGKKLIIAGVLPADLTTLRFATLSVLTGGYLLIKKYLNSTNEKTHYKSLSPFNIYLLLSGVGIYATAFSSYIAVQHISALTYGLSMNIGIASILLWEQLQRQRGKNVYLVCTMLLFVLTTLYLLYQDTGSLLTVGALAGMGCGIGFAIYTSMSKKYQVQESVRSRYVAFIFYFSIIAFLLSLPFAISSGFPLWQSNQLLPSLAFVFFLTAVPYLIHFELQKYNEVKATWSYVPLFLVMLSLGQYVFYGTRSWVLLAPIILALLWKVNYSVYKTGSKT